VLYVIAPSGVYGNIRMLLYVIMTVGYKMDTLYFSALSSPIDIDRDIVLPEHLTMVDSNVRDCSMNYTAGRPTVDLARFFLLTGLGIVRGCFYLFLHLKQVQMSVTCTSSVLNIKKINIKINK